MKKVVVTGGAGLLGQALITQLQAKAEVLAFDIAPDPFENLENLTFIQTDLNLFETIKAPVLDFKPRFLKAIIPHFWRIEVNVPCYPVKESPVVVTYPVSADSVEPPCDR